MQTKPTYAADLALMQAALDGLHFHAQRLRDASLNAGSATVAEPRIIEACQLAEHVLCTIDFLPALYATHGGGGAMNLRKRIREIERRAGIAIVAITRTRGGHLRLTLPCGRFVITSSTPSDHRTISNVACSIRRAQHQGNKRHAH